MPDRNWFVILVFTVSCTSPAITSGQDNIYRDAIPHIRACISLIQERATSMPDTASASVDLRAVCPTLVDFLSYEPISEIDPPLENTSSVAYLVSLLDLLETSHRPADNRAVTRIDTRLPAFTGGKEPDQKPFFLAIAQWSFAHLHKWLDNGAYRLSPHTRHVLEMSVLNLVIVLSAGLLTLYLVAYSRKTGLYAKHFRIRWQRENPHAEQPLSLEDISTQKLPTQIPALVKLVKQALQNQYSDRYATAASNMDIIHVFQQDVPDLARDIGRLFRLHDRIQYGNKTPAADEINQAFELVRNILNALGKT